MKLLVHVIVIAAVMLGSDFIANDARETERLVRELRPQAMLSDAKLRQHQMTATLHQRIYAARPQLVFAKID